MGYERTLVTRWTRRDWLAIAVIALTTTFLVGSSLTILAAGAQFEGEVETLDAMETAAFTDGSPTEDDGVVELPVAAARINGTNATVIGVPDRSVRLTSSFDDATLEPPPPDGVVTRGNASVSEARIEGRNGTVTREIRAASNRSVLPERWYATDRTTVRELGQTGAFEVRVDATDNDTDDVEGIARAGTFLLGTPAFLVGGGRAFIQLLGLVLVGSGLLVGVTVYSVTRMTVRDRRRTLFVVRSTGGDGRRLLGLFGLRAGLLTAGGGAFGYAFGVILVNAILNVATYVGTLTTLDISGSAGDTLLIAGMLGCLIIVGAAAGALSVARTVHAVPASLMGSETAAGSSDGVVGRLSEALGLRVVGLRTLAPMVAALTVLMAIAVVSVSVGLTLAPLTGATDGVVMSPDASYPLQSQVDRDLARSFRIGGVAASPEVLLPQVEDGQPYVLRGVNYSAYTEVSDVELSDGRRPTRVDQAVIGTGLSRTLGVGIGDRITVGGGTAFGVDRVTVVGRFEGPGYLDDQLLIQLPAAQGLANLDRGTVQIVRTTGIEEPPDDDNDSTTPTPAPRPADIVVTDVSIPETAFVNESIPVNVTLTNNGGQSGDLTLSVPRNGTTRETAVTVEGGGEHTVTLEAVFNEPGFYTVTLGGVEARIEIVPKPSEIVVTNVSHPKTATINQTVPVNVTLTNPGDESGNITLSVPYYGSSDETTVTVEGGQERTVTLQARFQSPGTYTITVDNIDTNITIVEPDPADIVVTDVSIPETGFATLDTPVEVTLANRGDRPGDMTLSVPYNGTPRETTVTVEGGQERTVTLRARFQSPGTYTITVGGTDSEIQIVEPDPADITVTDVSTSETGFVNESIPVGVTLTNQGDRPGDMTLSVPYNGTPRETTVTVEGGQERTVTLRARFQSPGTYTITVGGTDSEIQIVEPGPADITVTDVSTPETAVVNRTVPVNVSLANRGDEPGEINLTIPYNANPLETTVPVGANQRRNITLVAAFRSPGAYAFVIGGIESEITVLPPPADVVVTNLSVPETWSVNATVPVNVTLRNRGGRPGTLNLTVPAGGSSRDVRITVNASRTRSVTLNASYFSPGRYLVTVGEFRSIVRIVDPANLSLSRVPERAPPGATIRLEIRDQNGRGVTGVTVQAGERTAVTGANGTTRLVLPETAGEYELRSRIGPRIVHERDLTIREGADRLLLAELDVSPEEVNILDEVTVTVRVYNPWAETRSRDVVLKRENETVARETIELRPGEMTSRSITVEPLARGGSQEVTLVDSERVATGTFTVTASDRLIALLGRSRRYEPGSSLIRSIESLVGNFQIIQVTIVALAFLMGTGTTAAVVIQAVHARRRTLGVHQATGASPRRIVRIVLGDGLRLGAVASVIGVAATYVGLTVLVETGYTVLFGVRIAPLVNAWVLGGLLAGALLLVGVSSLLAAGWTLRVDPGDLLTGSSRRTPEDRGKPARPDPEVE
jgi:ABC-type lipoprotein release transport system permease subunit